MKFRITRATMQDLTLMQRLFYQSITTFRSDIFTKTEIKMYSELATNKNYWNNRFSKHCVYNAKLNGEIIGSVSMKKNGFIEYVFVHKSYQNQGIARCLYAAIENEAQITGVSMLTVRVNMFTMNFFQKNDFKIIENLEEVVDGGESIRYNGIKYL